MKNAAFYSVFSVTAGTINAYCFKKKGAEKFIEGQDSACCYWLGTGKRPEENVFPARNVFFHNPYYCKLCSRQPHQRTSPLPCPAVFSLSGSYIKGGESCA